MDRIILQSVVVLALCPVLPFCVLCESCSLLQTRSGKLLPCHVKVHTTFCCRGAQACELLLFHCSEKPCSTDSLKNTPGTSVVLLLATCYAPARTSLCAVGVSSPYPGSVFCYYSLLFSPFSVFFLYYLFGYLERGARRNNHSYQTVVDDRTRYCHHKDFLVIVPGGDKLCPAACNGFKLPSVELTYHQQPTGAANNKAPLEYKGSGV